jgi:hypothetical protein
MIGVHTGHVADVPVSTEVQEEHVMKDVWVLFAAVVVMLAAAGCSRRVRTESDIQALVKDYDKTWQAVDTVMSKHFMITEKDKHEGLVRAAPVRNDGRMGQAETRVSARIFPSKGGGYEVEVRAVNCIEVSEPYALSDKTARYQWVPVGFDQRLQTELLNEIDRVRYEGREAAYQNKFLESPEGPAPAMPE